MFRMRLAWPLTLALVGCTTAESGAEGDSALPQTESSGAADLCDGQEVDLQTNKYHCGACNNECIGAEADDPSLSHDTPACVAGTCQTAWNFCSDLAAFEGQSCASLCPNGCAQNACNGETLALKLDTPSVGISSCDHDEAVMTFDSSYQCDDPLPASTAEGLKLDLFSCCCAPATAE